MFICRSVSMAKSKGFEKATHSLEISMHDILPMEILKTYGHIQHLIPHKCQTLRGTRRECSRERDDQCRAGRSFLEIVEHDHSTSTATQGTVGFLHNIALEREANSDAKVDAI
jgi:hypothetical protein